MTEKQDTDPIEEPKTEPTEPATAPEPQKSAPSTPAAGEPQKGYVTEESYKGLQRVVTQKDKELEKTKQQLEDIATELEQLKTDSSSLSSTKSNLEAKLEEAQTLVSNLQSDRDNLAKQVERQSVIMTDYPQLASLAEYIPAADDAETFKQNAQQFAEALDSFVDKGVKTKLSGATGGLPAKTEDTTAKQDEISKLWDIVDRTAGVQGKEDEFRKAQERLEELLPE